MAKAVKLADIAERVGVSTVTVSKALSGQKGVSEEVREKIRSIAEELGYQQPSAARKSQNQKSYNIGILISERFLDKYESFYWQMYQAVATRATAKECFTMLEVIGMSEEENGRMPKLVQERKVDGIIVIGKMMDTYLQHLNTEAGIPPARTARPFSTRIAAAVPNIISLNLYFEVRAISISCVLSPISAMNSVRNTLKNNIICTALIYLIMI